MKWNPSPSKQKQQKLVMPELSSAESNIVNHIRNKTKAGIDDIAFTLQIDSGNLSLTLLDLEFKGIIRQLPGK
ncbi:MAG: hypothetical protein V4658_12430, partial [Bacteroidota bacterium]